MTFEWFFLVGRKVDWGVCFSLVPFILAPVGVVHPVALRF